jgi:hypothetical protein
VTLFVCENCRTIDNSACSPSFAVRAAQRANAETSEPILCTLCESGHWHDEFKLRIYDPDADGPIGEDQRLLTPDYGNA